MAVLSLEIKVFTQEKPSGKISLDIRYETFFGLNPSESDFYIVGNTKKSAHLSFQFA